MRKQARPKLLIQPEGSWADSLWDSWVRRCFGWHHWKIAETQGCSRSRPCPSEAGWSLCYCTASAGQQRALRERRQEKTNSHPVLNVAVAEILRHPFSEINLGEWICPFDSAIQYVPLRLLIITCNFFPFLSFFNPTLDSDLKMSTYLEMFLQMWLEFAEPLKGDRKQYSALQSWGQLWPIGLSAHGFQIRAAPDFISLLSCKQS